MLKDVFPEEDEEEAEDEESKEEEEALEAPTNVFRFRRLDLIATYGNALNMSARECARFSGG